MGEVFKTKVRNVGTSLGVLLPKTVVEKENVGVGDEVEISVLKSLSKDERIKLIKESFGLFKRMKKGKLPKFERDHKDHDFDVTR